MIKMASFQFDFPLKSEEYMNSAGKFLMKGQPMKLNKGKQEVRFYKELEQ